MATRHLTPTYRLRPTRAHLRRGNAMLEAAWVLMPFLALFFALFDFSLSIFIQNTLRNAAREGIRYAITQQTGSSGQDAAIKAIVKSNALGFLPDTSKISITYLRGTDLQTVTGTGSNGGGNICIVSISNFTWGLAAPLWQVINAVTYSVSSSDVMEAPPNGILPTR